MHHSERQFTSEPSVHIGQTKKFPPRTRRICPTPFCPMRISARCHVSNKAKNNLCTRHASARSVPRGAVRVYPFSYIQTVTKPSSSLTEPMLTDFPLYKVT